MVDGRPAASMPHGEGDTGSPNEDREIKTVWGHTIRVHPTSGSYRPELFDAGLYNCIEPFIFAQIVRRGMNVIDAGTSNGYFTLLAALKAGPSAEVVAIEPSPATFRRLSRNVSNAEFPDGAPKITLVHAACHRRNGCAALYLSSSHDERDSLISSNPPNSGEAALITIRTLDQIAGCHLRTKTVGMLKVDVEGLEYDTLLGAQHIIHEDRPTLWVEYWPAGLGYKKSLALLRMLREISYTRVMLVDVLHGEAYAPPIELVGSCLRKIADRRPDWSAGPGTIGSQRAAYLLIQHEEILRDERPILFRIIQRSRCLRSSVSRSRAEALWRALRLPFVEQVRG
jgi:FkbM family methyltransferase